MSDVTCSVDGCNGKVSCRGMCNRHYQRWYRAGGSELAAIQKAKNAAAICMVGGCAEHAGSSGMCRRHYNAKYLAVNRDHILSDMKVRSHAYYLAHRDEVLTRTRQYVADHRPDVRRRAREHYYRYQEREQTRSANWRRENPERYRAQYTNYAKQHPEYRALLTRRRKARMRGNGVFEVTVRDLKRCLDRYDHRCAYCGCLLNDSFDWDHIVPIARGGSHSIGNLAPACISCNRSKWSLTVTEWKMRDARRARALKAAKVT